MVSVTVDEWDTVPVVTVSVTVYVCGPWPKNPLVAPHPVSPATAARPATNTSRTEIVLPARLAARLMRLEKGNRRTPSAKSGNFRSRGVWCSFIAVIAAVVMLMVRGVIGVFAGSVQVLVAPRTHTVGATVTVAPVGNPVMVNVVGSGKTVPLMGVIVSV